MRHQFTLLLREMKFLPHDDPKAREVNKYSRMSKFPIHSIFLIWCSTRSDHIYSEKSVKRLFYSLLYFFKQFQWSIMLNGYIDGSFDNYI